MCPHLLRMHKSHDMAEKTGIFVANSLLQWRLASTVFLDGNIKVAVVEGFGNVVLQKVNQRLHHLLTIDFC